MQRRTIAIAIASVAAVVAVVGITSVVRSDSAVTGDGVTLFEPSELGLPDDVSTVSASASAGGLTALTDGDGAVALVGSDGRAVSRGLPPAPVVVRRDGSGVSVEGTDDAVRVTGFDRKGGRTFEIGGEQGIRALADGAGATLPEGDLRAVVDVATSTDVVVEACVDGDDQDASALLGLDSVTGKVRWHRVDQVASCSLRDGSIGTSRLLHRRLLGAENMVLDAGTGDIVWRLDDSTTRVAVVGGAIYMQPEDGSLTRLDEAGRTAWTVEGCRDDYLLDQPLGTIALRSSGPFMVLSCGSRHVAVKPETGSSRDLPRQADAGDERYVDDLYSAQVAPSYLYDAPEAALDRPVTSVVGTVLVTRRGHLVRATDAVSGKQLWTHRAKAGDRDRLAVQTIVPDDGSRPGAVVVRRVSYEQSNGSDSWKGSAEVTVLDARTGRQVARTHGGGSWTVRGTPAGDVLLLRDRDHPTVAVVSRTAGR